MWPAPLILMAQLLHREILAPAEAKFTEKNAEPAKSEWPLKECPVEKTKQDNPLWDGCVCREEFEICQPLQLSAWVNGSVTLPCTFTYHQDWEPSRDAQVHWRLDSFHSKTFLFNCCKTNPHTHSDFSGRVSLAREKSGTYTASIHITALRESDSRIYFCRVSVKTKGGWKTEEWQTHNGTNLTVTAHPPQPEGQKAPLLIGVLTVVGLLAAAAILVLMAFLLAWRKGRSQKRAQTRRAVGPRQQETEVQYEEVHLRGAPAPPLAAPASQPLPNCPQLCGEPGLVYASLVLSDARSKMMPLKTGGHANEETTYAAVRP